MDCCRQDGASPGNLEDRQLGRRSDRHRQGQWKTKAELSDRCSSPLAQPTDRQTQMGFHSHSSRIHCAYRWPESQRDGQQDPDSLTQQVDWPAQCHQAHRHSHSQKETDRQPRPVPAAMQLPRAWVDRPPAGPADAQ